MKHHHSFKRTIFSFPFIMGLGLLFVSKVVLAVPIYDIDRTIGTGSVMGTIETDGTLGVLTSLNIIDYSLTLDDGVDSRTVTFAAAGAPEINGTAFTATATQLLYDFNLPFPNRVRFEFIDYTPTPDEEIQWLMFSTSDPLPGIELILHLFGRSGSEGVHSEEQERFQANIIGTARPAAIPEPSTLALLSLGLAGLGFGRRYRRRQSAVG